MSKVLRNLEVPYFSQRENKIYWHKKFSKNDDITKDNPELIGNIDNSVEPVSMAKQSCNITSLAMLLHYFGVTSDTPDEMMRKVFEPSETEFAKYTSEQKKIVRESYTNDKIFESIYTLQTFVQAFYNVTAEVAVPKKFDEVKNNVLAGYPCLVSCGIIRDYDITDQTKKVIKGLAYDALFGSESWKQYDEKIALYNASITKYENQLENGELLQDEKEKIERNLTKVKNDKKQLEDAYEKKQEYYLTNYRFRGHYVVIRGISEDGVIINDPWGKPFINSNGKGEYYTIMIGDNVFLKQKEFDKQYFQDGYFYSCLTIKAKRWNFISRDPKYDIINKDFLQNCRDAEQFDFGGYPIKRSNLWHNGIHYGNKIGNKIYPIGAGQLIAARVVNKDTEKDEEPKNGSRCFVLIKHQVIVAEKLQDFFVCYMHLKPIEDLGSYIQSSRKTNIKWLDELIKRSKKTNRIRYGIENTEFYSLNDTEGKKSVGKLPSSGIFIVNDEKNEKGKIFFYYEKDNQINEYWLKSGGNIIANNDSNELYIKKLDELKKGKVVYFGDFNDKDSVRNDSMIEVSNSVPIGFMGKYRGINCNDAAIETLHMEIFSNDIIINDIHNFIVIKETDIPANLQAATAMCNRKEMIRFFEDKKLYGNWSFLYLKEDGAITKHEMLTFYKSNEGAARFQDYIVQHMSEWSDKIDWEQAFEKAKGVSNKGLPTLLPKNEDFEETLKEYVTTVYNPYKWLTDDCVQAMSTTTTLLKKGYATFYHPARFIKWLYDNNK